MNKVDQILEGLKILSPYLKTFLDSDDVQVTECVNHLSVWRWHGEEIKVTDIDHDKLRMIGWYVNNEGYWSVSMSG